MSQVTLLPVRWKFEFTQLESPPGGGLVHSLAVQTLSVVGGGDIGMPTMDIWDFISQRIPGGSSASAGARTLIKTVNAASRRPDHRFVMNSPLLGMMPCRSAEICSRGKGSVKLVPDPPNDDRPASSP
jgi:hypothetical protein